MSQTRYRPAADVARDLLKLATTRARRPRKAREPVRNVRPAPVDDDTLDAPAAPKITLPELSMRDSTDASVGLPFDPIAQERAERFLTAAYAYTLREKEKAKAEARARIMPGPTIHVEVADHAVQLVAPTDTLDVDDHAILAELRRLAARPPISWLNREEDPVPLAS